MQTFGLGYHALLFRDLQRLDELQRVAPAYRKIMAEHGVSAYRLNGMVRLLGFGRSDFHTPYSFIRPAIFL